jgi:hypothetical protein
VVLGARPAWVQTAVWRLPAGAYRVLLAASHLRCAHPDARSLPGCLPAFVVLLLQYELGTFAQTFSCAYKSIKVRGSAWQRCGHGHSQASC